MSTRVKRILVVDDEEDIVELVAWNLRHKGYEVIVAYDGETAISVAEQEVPDLILLDYMLPGLDGLMVLRRLSQGDTTRHAPIVMVTACRESSLMLEAVRQGATDVMHKPFSVPELLQWVERWLSGTGLVALPPFVNRALHSMGQTDCTTQTDTNPPGSGPRFYRIRVQ